MKDRNGTNIMFNDKVRISDNAKKLAKKVSGVTLQSSYGIVKDSLWNNEQLVKVKTDQGEIDFHVKSLFVEN